MSRRTREESCAIYSALAVHVGNGKIVVIMQIKAHQQSRRIAVAAARPATPGNGEITVVTFTVSFVGGIGDCVVVKVETNISNSRRRRFKTNTITVLVKRQTVITPPLEDGRYNRLLALG